MWEKGVKFTTCALRLAFHSHMTTFITTHVFIFKCDSFHVLYYFVFMAANHVLVLTILCLGTVFFFNLCCVYKE